MPTTGLRIGEGQEPGREGESGAWGPEGEVLLAGIAAAAATALHATEKPDQLVADNKKAIGVPELVEQGIDAGGLGDEAIGGDGRGGILPALPVGAEMGMEFVPGTFLEGIDGLADGGDGGGLAGSGVADEGNPEGGALVPAGGDLKGEGDANDSAGEGEKGKGDGVDSNVGGAGGSIDPGTEGLGKGIQGERRIEGVIGLSGEIRGGTVRPSVRRRWGFTGRFRRRMR